VSKRSHRSVPASGAGAGAELPTVTVCRGCCCGSPKIPGLDHAAQLRDLRQALGGSATVRVNVVVIQPSATGRRAGGRPVWLGLVNDRDATVDIAAWVASGGPGVTGPPGILDLYAFSPPRRVRAELDE
jgi:hypothetical protein